MDEEVAQALATAGVVARRDRPDLAARLSRLCRAGSLTAVLPGVYAATQTAADWRIRVAAACHFDRTAVITGDAAAALTYWPELTPSLVQVAGRRSVVRRPGFVFEQRSVPGAMVIGRRGLRLAAPELTALDQVADRGGDGIDRALRSRMTTLAKLHEALALTPSRRGNRDRRVMLLDSRDEPWSAAERLAHRVFREAGITGWATNVPILCGGNLYYLDIDFRRSAIAVEIDGRMYHGPAQFENDRRRGNDLMLAGKRMLHYTWRMLADEPRMVVETTLRALG